jgi:hypothetical protein
LAAQATSANFALDLHVELLGDSDWDWIFHAATGELDGLDGAAGTTRANLALDLHVELL